jgi:hypothetical protein
MKKLVTISSLTALCLWGLTSAEGQTTADGCDRLYQTWHHVLDAHPALSRPSWVSTDGPKDLSAVLSEMESNRIVMAYFLCSKLAAQESTNTEAEEGSRLHKDIVLLDKIAGINLLFPEDPGERVASAMPQNLNRFRAEWQAGVYRDPSRQIAALCEQRLSKEGASTLGSRDVIALRRYGIFGLPELIRQIKQHNSKHAFAAYLVITRQPIEYGAYLNHADEQFTTASAKLEQIKARIEAMKFEEGADDFEVVKKISNALAN